MGADIYSFLEIKDSRTKRWLVAGKNLTVEHFDLDKECPELKINFSMGNMHYNWRDTSDSWREWLNSLEPSERIQGVFNHSLTPINTRERILLLDYEASRFGHKSEEESIVSPFTWRSYLMFGILANCRYEPNEIEAISKPKGWPRNPSDFNLLYNYWFESGKIHDLDDYYLVTDGNLHHISYLSIQEFEKWLEDPLSHAKTDELKKELENYYIKYVQTLKDELKKLLASPNIEDVRIVFGFDS